MGKPIAKNPLFLLHILEIQNDIALLILTRTIPELNKINLHLTRKLMANT